MESLTIKRDKLYKLVWEVPITRLSKQYGLSDVGLAKICKRLNVPRPGRGLWARKKKGWPIKIPPLPPLKSGQPAEIHRARRERTLPVEFENSETEAFMAIEKLSENRIIVPDHLTSPHPLVKEVKRILKGKKPDEYGRIWSWKEPCLDIRVSPGNLERALRIMDSLIKSLAKRGCEVLIENKESHQTTVIVLDGKVHIGIEENSRRIVRELTAKEKKDRERWPSIYSSAPYQYIPSGALTLKIKDWGSGIARKSWTDGKKQRLEDCLNDFMIGLHRTALAEKQERRVREERERLWEEERHRREEQARSRQEEEERIKALEQLTGNWHKSLHIRSFLNALKDAAIRRHGQIEPGSDLEKWFIWANHYADRINPLSNDDETMCLLNSQSKAP